MMAQHDLGRKFRNGSTTGTASNVKIIEHEEATLLVGYGWAIYAMQVDGSMVYFKDWYGYSPSTSSQLSKMGLEANADVVCDDIAGPSITGSRSRRTWGGRTKSRMSVSKAIEHVRDEHL